MARPLRSGKQTVRLSESSIRVSRIRRDPPPSAKATQLTIQQRNERDMRLAIVGIIAMALALSAIIIGFGGWGGNGWSIRDYVIHI